MPALVLILSLVGCMSADDKRVQAILDLSGDADNGAVLYAAECADCHGAMGEGGTEEGIAGEDGDAEELVEVILFGEEQEEGEDEDEEEEEEGSMPAFEDVFSDQEVADLVAWLLAEVVTGEEEEDD